MPIHHSDGGGFHATYFQATQNRMMFQLTVCIYDSILF
jgi:hypothetical protein